MSKSKKRMKQPLPPPARKTITFKLVDASFKMPTAKQRLPPGEYNYRVVRVEGTKRGFIVQGRIVQCRRCEKPAMAGRTCCAEHDPGEPLRACPGPLTCRGCATCRPVRRAPESIDVWITRTGQPIPITELSNSHLANSIALLVRKLGMLTSEAARRAREAELQSDTLVPSPSGWEEGWG